jgi:CBS domain-containing protein
MTTQVPTVHPDDLIRDAARLMLDGNISGLPVTDAGGHLMGIVT